MLAEVLLDLQGGATAGATLEALAVGALRPFDVGVCPEVCPQMAHLNVLEGGEVSVTDSLMLEGIGPLHQNVIVMAVVTGIACEPVKLLVECLWSILTGYLCEHLSVFLDIQVSGGTLIVLQGATGAPELLQGVMIIMPLYGYIPKYWRGFLLDCYFSIAYELFVTYNFIRALFLWANL